MGLLDLFKKKNNKQPFPMNGPNNFNGYQQPYQNMQNSYGARPNFGQRYPYNQTPRQLQPYQQNFYPPTQQIQHVSGQQGHYQQPIAYQPQLNAHQQYINQNKLLQPVPFQNQPVMQSHNSGNLQQLQQGSQHQFPMTGQAPEKEAGENPGFLSRIMGGDTSITGVIGSMQRAVQAAQQVTPMIQQYAPAIKNFPSIYKIFKAVNTDDPADSKKSKKNESNETVDLVPSEETKPKKRKKASIQPIIEPTSIPNEPVSTLNPKPKLFV